MLHYSTVSGWTLLAMHDIRVALPVRQQATRFLTRSRVKGHRLLLLTADEGYDRRNAYKSVLVLM